MRLLFDQNLPVKFEMLFSSQFPQSMHVKTVGLAQATDRAIWDFARERGFAIVSKDGDFHHLSFLLGAPPKVIWLRCGNASVFALEKLFRESAAAIERFLLADEEALFVVS